MDLEGYYNWAKNTRSDIYEHIETLYRYSTECQHITECGVRDSVSTWAFIKGLHDNKSQNKRFIGVDIDISPREEVTRKICADNNIRYDFMHGSDLEIQIEQTDLLFIDTWHVYGQLKRELENMSKYVNRYIIMHDTTVDEWVSESIRNYWDIKRQAKTKNWPLHDIYFGLIHAVIEFLNNHHEFRLRERYTNCNGLTVLERRQLSIPFIVEANLPYKLLQVMTFPGMTKQRLGPYGEGGYVMINNFNFENYISVEFSVDFNRAFAKKFSETKCDDTGTLGYIVDSDYHNIFLAVNLQGREYLQINSLPDKYFKRIDQMIIVLYGLIDDKYASIDDKLTTLTKLIKYHNIVHAHGNNYHHISEYQGFKIPYVLELTLLNKKFSNNFQPNQDPLPCDQDSPCNPVIPDCRLDYAPFVEQLYNYCHK